MFTQGQQACWVAPPLGALIGQIEPLPAHPRGALLEQVASGTSRGVARELSPTGVQAQRSRLSEAARGQAEAATVLGSAAVRPSLSARIDSRRSASARSPVTAQAVALALGRERLDPGLGGAADLSVGCARLAARRSSPRPATG